MRHRPSNPSTNSPAGVNNAASSGGSFLDAINAVTVAGTGARSVISSISLLGMVQSSSTNFRVSARECFVAVTIPVGAPRCGRDDTQCLQVLDLRPCRTDPRRQQPYATIVTKDYPDDTGSDLDPPGRGRLNIHVGKDAFTSLIDDADTSTDASKANVLLPYPVY